MARRPAWSANLVAFAMGFTLFSAGAVAAAVAYAWLAVDHGSVGSVVAANVSLGFGIGLAFDALTNLVVRAVSEQRTAVFAATTAVSRATGAALGTQVALAVIIGSGVVPPGSPAERGFTGAFVLGLIAALVALAATVAIPHRRRDPPRQDAQGERGVAAS